MRKLLFYTVSKLAEENSEYITQLKLFTSNIASGGATIGINLDVPPTEADITGDLQDFLTTYFEYTKAAIEFYVSDMFNGSNTTQFENTFGTGVWAWPSILPALNDTNFDTEVSTVYFGVLAVPAWTIRQLNPVLMYDDKDPDCSAADPFHDPAGSYEGAINGLFGIDASSTQAYTCYDNKKLWLASWAGEWKEIEVPSPSKDTPSGWHFAPAFSGLIGIDTLNGTAWGTLTQLDIVTSAWQGYKSNNYTNDYSTDPLFDGSAQSGNVSLEFGDGIQTPGLVQMIVCPLSSLIRDDTILVGNVPNITGFASSPCPDPAYFNCPTLPCDGVTLGNIG